MHLHTVIINLELSKYVSETIFYNLGKPLCHFIINFTTPILWLFLDIELIVDPLGNIAK